MRIFFKFYLPRDVSFPTPPGFTQMLQDRSGFVLLDTFRHHVNDIVHNGSSQLQVKVGFYSLLGNGFSNSFRVTALELPRQQVTQPTLEERRDPSHEEEPYSPAWRPETATRTFSNWTLQKI